MGSIKGFIKLLNVSLLLLSFLALYSGCQPVRPAENVTPSSLPETVVPVRTFPIPSKSSSPTGVTGQIFSASDVSGQPDEPLAGQMVLSFPAERIREILGPGSEVLDEQELRFIRASISQPNPAISLTFSDAGGNYTFQLDSGRFVLCLADSEKTPPDFPVITRGCGFVEVTQGELQQVDISSGFGEIMLVKP